MAEQTGNVASFPVHLMGDANTRGTERGVGQFDPTFQQLTNRVIPTGPGDGFNFHAASLGPYGELGTRDTRDTLLTAMAATQETGRMQRTLAELDPIGKRRSNSHKVSTQCKTEGCTRQARRPTAHCVRHGGGKRCAIKDCPKAAGTCRCILITVDYTAATASAHHSPQLARLPVLS